MIGNFLQDVRYGFRMLFKSPVFTAVAVMALALGIGANTAIFSVINSVLLRPLPYAEPDRLMQVREYQVNRYADFSVSPGNFLTWQSQNTSFEQLLAYRSTSYNMTGDGEPERIRGARLSAGLITMLGIDPVRGRDFLAEEDQPGRDKVVILSHGLWQRRFGGNPQVIDQSVTLNGESYTVIGIMPPSFRFPNREMELWTPIAFTQNERQSYGAHYINALGRLKGGVEPQQAQAELDTIARQLEQEHPDTNTGWGVRIKPMLEQIVGDIRPTLFVLLGAVAFVLLIACANVANLLLARAATRQKEIAIRTAMGANRWRVVRQLLTESVLLAIIGGAIGLMLAVWGIDALLALAPEDLPRVKDVTIDSRVLVFTLGITMLTGIIFGLAPALQASKPDLNEILKEGGRGSSEGGRGRIRNALVVVEVAMALVLLVGGGLMIRSFWQLQHVDPGFNSRNAVTAKIVLPEKKYAEPEKQAAFTDQLLQNVSSVPGVEAAGVTVAMPFMEDYVLGFAIEGEPPAQPGQMPTTYYYAVSPGYFEAMGIPLLRGRTFTDRDRKDAPRVAVINQKMADMYFPGQDPIGKRIYVTNGPESYREVVGIVGDVKHRGLDRDTPVQFYEPFAQEPSSGMTLVVRSSTDATRLSAALRNQVLAIDKDQPISAIRSLDKILSDSVAQQRFSMLLLCIFATVALVLAAVGLYGVMAYSVTQRVHEIGIRMALGAQQSDVFKLVVGQGMMLALVGIALGLGAAYGLTRLMATLLFGVSATDPLTFAVISIMLISVTLLASYIPARRAARVDPMIALRGE